MFLEKQEAYKAEESNLSFAVVDLRAGVIVARFRYQAWGKLYLRNLYRVDSGNAGRYELIQKPWPEAVEPE